MKLFYPLFIAFFLTVMNAASAQTNAPNTNQTSTPDTYVRVKIDTQNDALAKLSALGIAVDHGDIDGHYFTTDLSMEEFASIKNDFNVVVLENDLEKFYAKRIADDLANPQNPVDDRFGCAYTTPTNFNLGTMGSYLTYQEMLNELDEMAALYPNLITIKQPLSATMTTAQGRPLYYVKISDNPNTNETEPKVLYTAVHHAREPMSMMSLIFYMHYLLQNYATDTEVQNLVNGVEMYFVPCVNPDGYIYNQTTNPNGGGMWRKNRRPNGGTSFGVDLNRNYGFQWGLNTGSSSTTTSDTYRGPSAFSEPETQMIRDFCLSKQFVTGLNEHSYSNLLIHPHEFENSVPEPTVHSAMSTQLTSCNGYIFGNSTQTVGYLASGTATDWMYGEQTAKPKMYAFTPEIGSTAQGFWPVSSAIIPLCNNMMFTNLRIALYAQSIGTCGTFAVNAGSDVSICGGTSTTLNAVVTAGTAPFTFAWDNGAGTTNPTTVSPTATTLYTVTISDATGCTATDQVRVNVSNCNGVCASPQTVVNTNGFETSFGIWVDGGTDCAIFTGYANTGTKSLQLRDNTSTSLASTGNLNLTQYNKIVVSFSYIVNSFDNSAEDFWLQLSTNGGSTYVTKEEWNLNDEFTNGVRKNENITIAGPFTSTSRLRFRCDASDDNDQVYLDDVVITGCLPLLTPSAGSNNTVDPSSITDERSNSNERMLVSPNPAQNDVNVQLFVSESQTKTIRVTDAFGRVVKQTVAPLAEGWNLINFNVADLPVGLYYIFDGTQNNQKFVKTN